MSLAATSAPSICSRGALSFGGTPDLTWSPADMNRGMRIKMEPIGKLRAHRAEDISVRGIRDLSGLFTTRGGRRLGRRGTFALCWVWRLCVLGASGCENFQNFPRLLHPFPPRILPRVKKNVPPPRAQTILPPTKKGFYSSLSVPIRATTWAY